MNTRDHYLSFQFLQREGSLFCFLVETSQRGEFARPIRAGKALHRCFGEALTTHASGSTHCPFNVACPVGFHQRKQAQIKKTPHRGPWFDLKRSRRL